MMGVLKKETGRKDQDTDKADGPSDEGEEGPRPAVEAGRISKEDTAKSRVRTEAAGKKLQARVQAGELTKEQALAKMSVLKAEAGQNRPKKTAAKGQNQLTCTPPGRSCRPRFRRAS